MMTFDILWEQVVSLQGCQFMTSGRGSRPGVPFTYTIHGGEMHVSNKNKSVTRATVELAFERAINQNGNVTGPKALGVFGSSYLFPIFQTVGIIRSIESEGEVKKCRGEKDQRT